jgi:hypothetical protein
MAVFDNLTTEASRILSGLEGQVCTEVYGGISVGAWIGILFGPTREVEGGGYQSDTSLEIEAADWRLLCDGAEVCTSNSPSGYDSEMHRGLTLLVGKEITRVRVGPGEIFSLRFTNMFEFEVWCDRLIEEDDEYFYMRIAGRRVVVKPTSILIENSNS